jgi:amino acid adenylation domain-containing protein
MAYLLQQHLDRTAERHGDRCALRFEKQQMLFSELAERSDQTGRALAELGVGRNDRVGIYMSKGIDAAVAMYGIWKAGAAFVPIDPWLPPDSLVSVLRDCGIRVLFVNRPRMRSLRRADLSGLDLQLIGVEESDLFERKSLSWHDISGVPASPPNVAATEQDLSYIFYTSGSTGEPKGMMHTHRSGLSFVDWCAREFELGPDDRVGNHAPLHFDLSLFDYVSAASVGATTVILSEERQKIPASVAQLIEDEGITVWYSVPAAWTQMLLRGSLDERDFSKLRCVLFAGEPFPPKLLQSAMEKASQARFFNLYGVTETNVCTFYPVPRPIPFTDMPVPIGRVCPNLEGQVLADDDQPVEPGTVGELVIRGPAVMRGYWNRPDLHREIFWRRPMAEGQDDLFYRTGDLVCEDEGGQLRFAGRKDRQIKSRGHRIELDDVQALLASDPTIVAAAVYTVPDGEGSLRVEAALELREGIEWSEAEVVRRLRQRTATYSVPARFIIVENLPRTSAGKIDFRALQTSGEGER